MTAAAQPETSPTPDPVRQHVEMIHQLAAGVDGLLVVSAFNASLKDDKGTITHHRVGDIDGMVDAITAHSSTPHVNVYSGLQVMRRGLARGQRGGEKDIVAVLGLVADMDSDTGHSSGVYPIDPNYVIETSPGNLQPMWLFEKPLSAATAKVIAKQLKDATGSDHGTGDITHVWRVPGTLNWPNHKKLERGRPEQPATVNVHHEWDGSLTNTTELAVALSAFAAAEAEARPVEIGEIPDVNGVEVSIKAAGLLGANEVANRSEHAAKVVEALGFDGHSAEIACALFLAASGDWLDRYPSKDAAQKDFARLWGKYGVPHVEARQRASDFAEKLGRKAGKEPPKADNDNRPQIPVVDPGDWDGQPIPERQWYIEGVIPGSQVTLLSGDGGTGKSLLAYQIGVAGALGVKTIGLAPSEGRVIYLAAEDDTDELRRRGFDILTSMSRRFADLAGKMRILPMAGLNAELMFINPDRQPQFTDFATKIGNLVKEFRPQLLILDTSADLYGADENNRVHVRFFVTMLRKLAMDYKLAILLLSHPSVSGMASGSGTSGSTAWNNSVRSRLYLTADRDDEDLRLLKGMKANYGRKGGELRLRWQDGTFVLDDGKPSAAAGLINKQAETTFKQLLSLFNRTGQTVSDVTGTNYAPAKMARHPDAKGHSKKVLAEAMQRLLDRGEVKIVMDGPPSRQRKRLILASEDFGPKEAA